MMQLNKLFSGLLAIGFAFSAQAEFDRSWDYQYDAHKNLTQIDGPRTDVQDITRFEYDEHGHLIKTINALGHTTELKDHNAWGSPQTLINANGTVTKIAYNASGKAETITVKSASGDITTRFTYDKVGQVTQVTLPNGTTIQYEYSPARYLMAMENSLGERIEYDYDNAGNQTKQTVKSATGDIVGQHSWVYDELSRLLRSVGASEQTTQHAYDVNSNQTGLTDPNKHKTTYGFDALNRLTQTTNALEGVTKLEYNHRDQITKVIAPNGATTQYEYDPFGRLIKRISPDTGTTTYAYDLADNIIQRTDARGVVTKYSYDALNRLTSQQYPASPELNITYIYDETTNGNKGIGRLTGLQDQSGLVAFSYDDTGRLTQTSRSMTIAGRDVVDTTHYQTDLMGSITQVTYPSGAKVDYARNPQGQVTTVTYHPSDSRLKPIVIAKDIGYQAYGPLTALTWGNNTQLTRTFDQSGQLTQQTVTGIQDLDYSYDPAGNITEISDGHNATYSASYQYDALDRLAQEQGYFGTKNYSFDPVGNRTERQWITPNTAAEGQPSNSETHSQTLAYQKDSNRLTKVNNQSITTDAAGHITDNNPLSFTYDARGRIHSVSKNGKQQAEYQYNVLGERVLKTRYKGDNKEYSTFHYNTSGQLLVDTLHDKNRKRLSRHYIWLGNMPLAMIEEVYQSNGKIARHQVNYIHADHLNAPRRASDTEGNTNWAWYRDAYGIGDVNQDVDGDGKKTFIALRFPGQYYDPESSLFYNYHRYYDPSVGRYTKSDPIGLQAGLNTFAYVEGNPANYIDSTGLIGTFLNAHRRGLGYDNAVMIGKMGNEAYELGLTIDAVGNILILGAEGAALGVGYLTAKALANPRITKEVVDTACSATASSVQKTASRAARAEVEVLNLEPGTIQSIKPNAARTVSRADLEASRVKAQEKLIYDGTQRHTRVKVDQFGNVIDGHHHMRAATKFPAHRVEVYVESVEGAEPGTLITELPIRGE